MKIAIWGLGYVGFSTMAHFAAEGVECIGYDIDKSKVDTVNKGECEHIQGMGYWLGFDTKKLAKKGYMTATDNYKDMFTKDITAHLICVPTERGAEPWSDALFDVGGKIAEYYKDNTPEENILVIVESTIPPDMVDDLIQIFNNTGIKISNDIYEKNAHIITLGVAPRRDWFVSPDKTVRTLPRIIGATNFTGSTRIRHLYEIICNEVIEAEDMKTACLVKSVENAFRQLDITFANELSLAYPDINITQVLKLAGTKWNVETYHPSVGIGGYCIPLAPKYLLRGAKFPECLNLVKASIKSAEEQPNWLINEIDCSGQQNIGILGLSYTKNLKVDILSPGKYIANELRKIGLDVKVNDPLYTEKEIKDLTGCDTFNFPDDLDKFDIVIALNDHDEYKLVNTITLLNKLKNVKNVIDNVGMWKDIYVPNYKEVGDKNWLRIKENGLDKKD